MARERFDDVRAARRCVHRPSSFEGMLVNKGPMATEKGTTPAANKALAVPFCDVYRSIDGRMTSPRRLGTRQRNRRTGL